MRVTTQLRCLIATAAVIGALGGAEVRAQTINPPVTAGAAPFAIAVNPITNKVYVTNETDNTLTVMDGRTLTVTSTLPVGARPLWLGVNPETNRVYVAQFGNNSNAPHLVAVNGSTDTVSSNITVGDVGWITINPVTNKTYTIRYGNTDEYSVTQGETFLLAESTREFVPVGHVVDPNRNILYTIDQSPNQVVPIDVTNDTYYPTRLCPDGAGGILPNPVPTDTTHPQEPTCIAINGTVKGITVNPVTGRAYAVSSSPAQVTQINAISETNPMTATYLTPPGVTGNAVAVAVNPVTNKIYAAFTDKVVVVNGADNTMSVIASGNTGGPAAVGINAMTNKVYVPNTDGTLTVIDGATNATQVLAIPSGAKGVAVNPVTNTTFVLSPSGITAINGANTDTVQTIPLTTAITHVSGDTTATSGSFSISATASAGFPAARKVYYQIDSTAGAWTAASGSGPFTASFSNLAAGQHTIYAFATDALDAPSIMNDVQNNPIVGNLTSYTFTASTSVTPPSGKAMTRVDFNGDGKTDFILQGSDGSYKAVLMDGMTPISSGTIIPAGSGITLLRTGDFNGDGKTDLVVENPDTSVSIWLMDSFTVTSQATIMPGGYGWLVSHVGDFNGDGKTDLVWHNTNGSVGVWIMDGTSLISRNTLMTANDMFHVANIGDFDGDGKDDILWRWNDGTTSMWLMDGSSIKQRNQIMPANPYWVAARVGDFDGDGKADILWHNQADSSNSMWLMDGLSIKQRGSIMAANSQGYTPMRVGDFNNDGKSDILWLANDGSVGLWLMNGLSVLERKSQLGSGNPLVPQLLGDLNADHMSDIFYTQGGTNAVTMWFMNGTSMSQSGTYTPPSGFTLWTGSDINR